MERLTEKLRGQNVIPLRQMSLEKNFKFSLVKISDNTSFLYGDPSDKLAAYEDTGLTPEEVGKMEYEYFELFQAHLQYLLDCRDDHIKQLEDECHKLNKLIDEVLMRCKRATKGEQ